MIVIGLVGAKQSGKSTFAEIVQKRYPFVRQGALADRLKQACSSLLNISLRHFNDPSMKEKEFGGHGILLSGYDVSILLSQFELPSTDENLNLAEHTTTFLETPRQVAQYVGTEVLRTVDPDVHCKGLMLTVEEMKPKPGVFIVTDLRFPNEYEFFASRFGTDFYPTYISNGKAEAVAAKDQHESERHVLEIAKSCRRIDNEGSLPDFEAKVINYVDGIFSQYEPEELRGE
jgi:hypothetical protein